MSFPDYNQTDGSWEYLCATEGEFKLYGCGICCAAMITEYKEGGIKDPEVMQERKVWTPSNLSTQWYNASTQFGWGGQEFVGNLSGAIKEIKNQVDKYGDPVVLRLWSDTAGNWQHFIVAYDYTGTGSSTSQILVRDPYFGSTTLAEALTHWPVFKYLKRVI